MTTTQLQENIRLSLTVPKGHFYKRPAFGHRLNELSNEKVTESTRRRAESYAHEALQWLMETERAITIDAEATYDGRDRLYLHVEVVSQAGQTVTFDRFVEVGDVQ